MKKPMFRLPPPTTEDLIELKEQFIELALPIVIFNNASGKYTETGAAEVVMKALYYCRLFQEERDADIIDYFEGYITRRNQEVKEKQEKKQANVKT